jgi:N-acetylglucosaminyldiphosphoundecaprenol N-acetyl-beta-D-mannosaminyltransferase
LSKILEIPIGVSSLEDIAQDAVAAIDGRAGQIVFACANAHSMNMSRRDKKFRQALLDADQVVADGSGVRFVARLAGKDVGPRIIGQAYFEALMKKLKSRNSGRVYFFGSSEATLNLIDQRFKRDYPELTFCGATSPPFGEWSDEANEEFLAKINDARPDVLWVGMTAPKQEVWVYENRRSLDVPVIGSIGAVFDFFAGTVKSSPQWVRTIGLEALYRLAMEPRRLWRRVLISSVTFLIYGSWYELRERMSPSGRQGS